LASGRSKLEVRLARWLITAHDRLDGNRLALTHEFLAIMLGVPRHGVTISLQKPGAKGLLETQRNAILIKKTAPGSKRSQTAFTAFQKRSRNALPVGDHCTKDETFPRSNGPGTRAGPSQSLAAGTGLCLPRAVLCFGKFLKQARQAIVQAQL
jgi:hypothetical protein